jgi:hypothetical protein
MTFVLEVGARHLLSAPCIRGRMKTYEGESPMIARPARFHVHGIQRCSAVYAI